MAEALAYAQGKRTGARSQRIAIKQGEVHEIRRKTPGGSKRKKASAT